MISALSANFFRIKPKNTYKATKLGVMIFLASIMTFSSLQPAHSGTFAVRIACDLNGDGKCDIEDVIIAANAFGSYPGEPNWNPNVDVCFDLKIDIRDIAMVVKCAFSSNGKKIDVWISDSAAQSGQGINMTADLVLPQTEITLSAKATENGEPVPNKKVTFEIRGPRGEQGKLWSVLQVDTANTTGSANGTATVQFRMPWTGHNAEEMIGEWSVRASVAFENETVIDFLPFDYDYFLHIWSVETDKSVYNKCDNVEITVAYGTKSKRAYDVTMYATIADEPGIPLGIAYVATTVGGGELGHYENFTETVTIYIPFFASEGEATIRVSFVFGQPHDGGAAAGQEVTTTILILPGTPDDPWFFEP